MRRVVVTGAFSYTGAAVAKELLARGYSVHTLTHRRPPPGPVPITCSPLVFEPDALVEQLQGADAFVNTFWIRLPRGGETFESGVEKSKQLVEAAARAGVRMVHLSESNASLRSKLGYYRGKALVEEAVRSQCSSYAIVRPTLVVGAGDVLTNNIGWFLRKVPFFPIPQGGSYRIQPVALQDAGRIIVDALEEKRNLELDAAGAETFTFLEYVRLLADACGVKPRIISVPDGVALAGIWLIGKLLGDIVLTREELLGLQEELLVSHEPPRGMEPARDWIRKNGFRIGQRYVNDLERHFEGGATETVLNPATL